MPSVHLLGTGAAVCDAHRTTTMLAVESEGHSYLIDCGGDVIQRALQSGLDLDRIEGLIVTHEHPDHVSGFPLFMERLWLAGRNRPIHVFGMVQALDQAQRVLSAFDIEHWDLPEIIWSEVECAPHAPVFETQEWRVTASPGTHSVPVMGYRFEHLPSGKNIVYSADTEPCHAIEALALGCDLLIHEATGEGPGHTSTEQAIAIGRAAGADQIVLVHLSSGASALDLSDFITAGINVSFGEELGVITV